jgi:uncharacterized protein
MASELEIVDVHQHVGPWGAGRFPDSDITSHVAERLRVLDAFGIDAACLMPTPLTDSSPQGIHAANMDVLVQEYPPERIAARLLTLPLTSEEAALAEFDGCRSRDFAGLTFHHWFQNAPIDHPVMWPVLEEAERLGVPVFLHVTPDLGLESLFRAERLAEDFPEVQFVILGAFKSVPSSEWAAAIATRRQNTWFDTYCVFPIGRALEVFCERVGHDRLLFGSDLYVAPLMFQFPAALYEILASPFEFSVKQAILGSNARRLLGPTHAHRSAVG